MTYLDHNASSPLLPVARTAWLDAVERFPGNPSSPHRVGARAEAALEEARQRLAARLGCTAPDLVWTSGATEACNTVLHHAAAVAPAAAEVWVSAIEHPAVGASARHYFGGRVREIPVDRSGVADLGWLKEHLRDRRPALVALMAANNETGVLQPWAETRAACAEAGVPSFCDATQWCGRRPIRDLGVGGFVAGSAHKFGGPRGLGFLLVPAGTALRPLLHGGKQLEGRRAGTENVAGVLAMMAALDWCEEQIAGGAAAIRAGWRDRFEAELVRALPGTVVHGANVDRLWNTSSLRLPAADCRHRWVVKLDKGGFAVSTGSACASGTEAPSPVLTAMGLTAEEASRALRVSAGWNTTEEEWTGLRQAIERIHATAAA